MKFSNLVLPFSVVAGALVIAVGGVLLLRQTPEPQATPPPAGGPTPTPQPVVEIPEDWLTYRNEELGFEVKYPPTYSIEETEASYGPYIAVISPQTQALREYTLGEESDAMMIMPRLTPEVLSQFSITNPNDRSGRFLSLREVVEGNFNFVDGVNVGGRAGFQFVYPGFYGAQEALKDTFLPNPDGTWFRVTWDTKFSHAYDLILSTLGFLR